MDTLNGSKNIDVNVSVGTIFSIFRRITPVGTPVKLEGFLQPGSGVERILDITPTEIHQRLPFFCGSIEMVDKLESFL